MGEGQGSGDQAAGSHDGSTVEALRVGCDEARHTIDHQLQWLQQMDHKAIQIFRANMLVAGLILTALSFATQAENLDLNQFVNMHTGAGSFLLITSTIFSGTAYLASSYEAGIGPNGLADLRTEGFNEVSFFEALSEWSETWLLTNQYIVGYNATMITFTVITVIDYVVFFSIGILVGSLSLKLTTESLLVFAGLCVFLLILDYIIFRIEDPILWYYNNANSDHPDIQ